MNSLFIITKIIEESEEWEREETIVQAYTAMEYRFTPERITVTTDDVACFLWSGENIFFS